MEQKYSDFSKKQEFDRNKFNALLERQFFTAKAADIYDLGSDYAGLIDLGPPGCGLQNAVVDVLREHFFEHENMLEINCSSLIPEGVLKASGHVDRFADWKCKDKRTGESVRADKVIETVLGSRLEKGIDDKGKKLEASMVATYQKIIAEVGTYNGDALAAVIANHAIRNPSGGGELEPPTKSNLMFKIPLGQEETNVFARPGTTQGQIAAFPMLLQSNDNMMPFASASIGKVFRNEIAPSGGLVRAREFLMADIEHYVDPASGKVHPRFKEVDTIVVPLLDQKTQASASATIQDIAIGKAVEAKIVGNQTTGYYLARVYLYLRRIGIQPDRIRFRQQLDNELAHYANSCWDAELLTSRGWLECVGIADRGSYDLDVHAKLTGQNYTVIDPKRTPHEYQPHIIEPSFGVGRIMYALLEHVYWYRPGQKAQEVLSFPTLVAPFKVLVLPKEEDQGLKSKVRELEIALRRSHVSTAVNSVKGKKLGARFRSSDEMGTPFCIVVDRNDQAPDGVMFRERDSTKVLRVPITKVVELVDQLVRGLLTWEAAVKTFPSDNWAENSDV